MASSWIANSFKDIDNMYGTSDNGHTGEIAGHVVEKISLQRSVFPLERAAKRMVQTV